MGQDGEVQSVEAVRCVYGYAWTGKRLCDLNMNSMNLNIIKDAFEDGFEKDSFVAIKAHPIHYCTGLIMVSEDLSVEDPMNWEEADQQPSRGVDG